MALAERKLRKPVSRASDSVERRIRFVASFARGRFGWWNLVKVACRDMVLGVSSLSSLPLVVEVFRPVLNQLVPL